MGEAKRKFRLEGEALRHEDYFSRRIFRNEVTQEFCQQGDKARHGP
jgi:hypothetical protein